MYMEETTPCTYCGDIAATRDHVPPVSVALRLGLPMKIVPACHECNVLLGNRPPWYSVLARRRTIGVRLRHRYAKALRIPKWREEEIGTLGPELQRVVREGLAAQRRARARLAWTAQSAVVHFLLVNFTRNGARRGAG